MCAAYSDAQVQEIIAERDGLYQTLAREVANVASATTRYMEAEAERDRLQDEAYHQKLCVEIERVKERNQEILRLRALDRVSAKVHNDNLLEMGDLRAALGELRIERDGLQGAYTMACEGNGRLRALVARLRDE